MQNSVFFRTTTLIASALGIVAYFLPWVQYKSFVNPSVWYGANIIGPYSLYIFIGIFLAGAIGKWQQPVPIAQLVVFLAGMAFVGYKLALLRLDFMEVVEVKSGIRLTIAVVVAITVNTIAAFFQKRKKASAKSKAEFLFKKQPDDAGFARFVLERTGKLHLLEPILERCKADQVSVHQHFCEGLEKNYHRTPAQAAAEVKRWYTEYQYARSRVAVPRLRKTK